MYESESVEELSMETVATDGNLFNSVPSLNLDLLGAYLCGRIHPYVSFIILNTEMLLLFLQMS
jgi:hypothetical protein